jgi:hypothetical protein
MAQATPKSNTNNGRIRRMGLRERNLNRLLITTPDRAGAFRARHPFLGTKCLDEHMGNDLARRDETRPCVFHETELFFFLGNMHTHSFPEYFPEHTIDDELNFDRHDSTTHELTRGPTILRPERPNTFHVLLSYLLPRSVTSVILMGRLAFCTASAPPKIHSRLNSLFPPPPE